VRRSLILRPEASPCGVQELAQKIVAPLFVTGIELCDDALDERCGGYAIQRPVFGFLGVTPLWCA